MRRDRERLLDILEAIQLLEPIRDKGRKAFDTEPLLRSAAERQLEIIGEAVTKLPAEVTARQPQIPWHNIIGSRTILAHVYWEVQEDVVWNTIESDLQPLKVAIQALLARPDIE